MREETQRYIDEAETFTGTGKRRDKVARNKQEKKIEKVVSYALHVCCFVAHWSSLLVTPCLMLLYRSFLFPLVRLPTSNLNFALSLPCFLFILILLLIVVVTTTTTTTTTSCRCHSGRRRGLSPCSNASESTRWGRRR